MCQCHFYFSSFTAQRPWSLTPTSFWFSPASPNTLCSEGRIWCQGARGIWSRDPRDYSTLLLGALSTSGRDYGDTGENRGIFCFVETAVAFLESNGNSEKLVFWCPPNFLPLHTPQCMGRCTQFFHCPISLLL